VHVRVTGVVIEDDHRILVLNQDTDTGRSWSLPGGKVEEGEPIRDALIREMREETGLDVEPGRLLYVCDHLPGGGTHVVHLTFEARRSGGIAGQVTSGLDTRPIRGVEFVKIADLPSLGFGERFAQLATDGFPGAGSYMGAKAGIGL
jgi:ADP-ribose pyrophosphatase YjhB (NUDIX family)